MREAGLDPMAPPATWNDLKAMAPKLDKGAAPDWGRVGFNPMWGAELKASGRLRAGRVGARVAASIFCNFASAGC
jgi:ABC-type glycerol-3-phosphate transport system substrate-binding protein